MRLLEQIRAALATPSCFCVVASRSERAKLGEGRQFIKLSQFQFECASDLLIGPGLRPAPPDPAHRDAHIDGWP